MPAHRAVVACRAPVGDPDALRAEHGVLSRRLAVLQHRVGEQLQQARADQQALEADNLRLRAALVAQRTAVAWQLGLTPLPERPRPAHRANTWRPAAEGLDEARALICETGCVGHAHPWLGDDGQCRLHGVACERVAPPLKAV